MKRFMLLLATLVAGVLIIAGSAPNVAQAGPVYTNVFWLSAFNESGGWCGTNCTVVAISYYCDPDCVQSGPVSGAALPAPCGGYAWNYGHSWCGQVDYGSPPTTGIGEYGSLVDVYVRKACPFGGYHFSPHAYFNIAAANGGGYFYLGRLQVSNNCQTLRVGR